jgi:ribosome recycling factor
LLQALVVGHSKLTRINRQQSRSYGRTGKWDEDEDSKLKDAVQTHGDKKWDAIAALVPGRTIFQCAQRWHDALKQTIYRANERSGKWAEDEDRKLKDAVQTHGDNDWDAVAALVLGRTRKQCYYRWKNTLDPSIDRVNRRSGKWEEGEDSKLKDSVQTHGGKNWDAIAALVPGRTRGQCRSRWGDMSDPNSALTAGLAGKWTEDEDSKLKDAVQMYGDKNWVAIAYLDPDRTRKQCYHRWKNTLNPCIALTAGRSGKWKEDEDIKVKDAVQTHGDKNWDAIAALVPGRTTSQCRDRWKDALNPSIALTAGRTGKWEEDSKLKDAVQTHGDKMWVAVAALIPGRTRKQCFYKWKNVLKQSIDRENGRSSKWEEDEDAKLKDAVQTHGGKYWVAVAALVPGRTGQRCYCRWKNSLNPSTSQTN